MPFNTTKNQHTRGPDVADTAALTSPATFNATTYTSSESNALRADVAALRTTVLALLAALREGANI